MLYGVLALIRLSPMCWKECKTGGYTVNLIDNESIWRSTLVQVIR